MLRLCRRKVLTMLKAIVTSGVFLGVTSIAFAQGTWSEIAPTPTPVEGAAIGQVGNLIISAYGEEGALGDSNDTRIYDISKNTWSLGSPAPGGPKAELAYGDASHGGFVYTVGGRTDFVPATNELDRYSPATNTWTVLSPMPTPRAAAVITSVDNALYVIGGRDLGDGPCTGSPLSVVERYDIDTDTWSTAAPLPIPLSDSAVATRGGKIYVIGGCTTGPTFTNTVFIYDPVKNVWTSGSPMPTPRATLTAATIGNGIYAVAGWNGGPPLTVNEVYDVAHDTWSTASPILVARGETNSISHGGRMYVIAGGQPGFGTPTADSEVFKP